MTEETPPAGENSSDAPNDRRPRRPKGNYVELGDAALIDAMRAGDERAIDEFIVRHERVVAQRAREAGILRRDYDDAMRDVILEVGWLIVGRLIRPTRGLEAYVVKCFFNRLAKDAEERKRQRRLHESAVLEVMSEYSVRSSHGPDWEVVPLPPPLERLASMIAEGLTAEEEQLLAWHSKYVPLREVASWLGISYANAGQRSWRLRHRLIAVAKECAPAFSREEWLEITKFFERCAVLYDRPPRRKPDNNSSPRTA
jgi:hypothetical protein